MEQSDTNRQNQETTIVCRDLWKIFGELPKDLDSTLLELENSTLSKEEILERYGLTVGVHKANFEIKKGEVFVIMGLSGSGKSTIVRCLNRLIEPSSGSVSIDGKNVIGMSKKELRRLCREKMGMVFQNFALIPSRTVLQNVTLGLEIRGVSKSRRLEKAREAINMVGLSGWEDRYCKQLSGGMQQRVGLARALAGDPELLLMDEAFSALDPLIRKQMQDEFLKLVRIVDKTIVFITHDLDEGLKLGDRIAVMKDGKIVQIGTPEDIVMRPGDEYVAEFVGAISRTKKETAGHLLSDPGEWACSVQDDPGRLLDKMRNQDYLGLLVLGEDDRILGVVFRDSLRQALEDSGTRVSVEPLLSQEYVSVEREAAVDELVAKAAQTSIPLVVLDKKKGISGIISRDKLLKELSEMI